MHNLNRESPSNSFEVIEGGKALQQDSPQVSTESDYEEKIEDRFRHLTGDIQHFASSLQAACLADYTPAREILDELAAKQGKLAWTIGVAKRLRGASSDSCHAQTGRRMWPDIERMLGDLESTLRLLSRLQFVEGHWRLPARSSASSYSDVS